MSGIQTNRSAIDLPAEVAKEIIQKTQTGSVVMQLARQTTLPGKGLEIPVITGDPEASWVAETGMKPVSNPSLSKKVMQGHKLVIIEPFSNEFRRDYATLYDELVRRLPNILAEKYDQTVFFGPDGTLANFDNFANVTAQSLSPSVYDGVVAAHGDIADQGGMMNGIVLSPNGYNTVLRAKDKNDRPLFIDNLANDGVNRILGASVLTSPKAGKAGTSGSAGDPATLGFAGDWSKAVYGIVEGVSIEFSSDATLMINDGTSTSMINLFQHNMFAVKAEIEVGFIAQTEYFNRLTA